MLLSGIVNFQHVFSIISASINHIPSEVNLEINNHLPSIDNHQITNVENVKPVVLWHGLGDNYNSSGMNKVKDIINSIYPDTFVYSIAIDEDPSTDQQRSMFGDANVELEQVCETLSTIPELESGFNAIGFSQGGVFIRALIERCPFVKVHNLVTFGSPHLGIMELPLCKDPKDWLCKARNGLLKKQVWFDSVQKRVIPAQYFRDPAQIDKYLEHSNLLADINNERVEKNSTYRHKFSSISKLVLITFTEDATLVPKDSAAFIDFDPETGTIIPFTETDLYQRDYIGLKQLHEQNKVEFLSIEADHMKITENFLREVTINYLGPEI